jgi:hypothetical protein
MNTRYQTYYRSIPSLGRDSADAAGAADRVRSARPGSPAVPGQPSALEALHPEIIQAVTLLWGYPEMDLYFEKLWLDDGTGRPIAPEAMSELMLLASVHRSLRPQRPRRSMASIYDASCSSERRKDIWSDVPYRR